jgi:hypothetical protein
MLFQQSSAPTLWTKQTTHNDKALRVVSGAASSGGSSAFSTVFAKTATDATTLSTSTVPSQSYTFHYRGQAGGGEEPYPAKIDPTASIALMGNSSNFSSAGTVVTDGNSGGSHTHPIDIRVQYVDLIIASKD